MRDEITKVVRVYNVDSPWGNDATTSTIAFKIDNQEKKVGKITFEKIAGNNLHIVDLINIFTLDIDILNNVKNYLLGARVNNFSIETLNSSGRREIYLYANSNLVGKRNNLAAELIISCFDKVDVNRIEDMWIGDLIEILLAAEPQYFKSCLSNVMMSKKGVRQTRKELFKYVKPLPIKKSVSMKDVLNWEEIQPINEENDDLKSSFEIQMIGEGNMIFNSNSNKLDKFLPFDFNNIRVLSTSKEVVIKLTNKFVLCFNIEDGRYRKTSWKSIKNEIKDEYNVDFHVVLNCKLEANIKINDKLYYNLSLWLRDKNEIDINRCLFHSIEEDGSLYVYCTDKLKIYNDNGPKVWGDLDSYLRPISIVLK